MSNSEIKQLFRFNRFSENEVKVLCLVLYIPVGLVLFVLRSILALALVVGCSLSDSSAIQKIVNKIARLALGISVTADHPDKKDDVDVFISNKLSAFDHLAVHTVTGSLYPGKSMHPILSQGLGLAHFGSQTNLETFKKNILKLITEKKCPIYMTPEEKITNGKALLKFKNYPFSLSNRVQPVCITIERPLLDISVSTIGSSYWTDIFFYMFSPLTNYKLTFLAPVEKKDLSDAEFAEAVRQNIASTLKIPASDFSASDLNDWQKRWLVEQERIASATAPRSVSRVDDEHRRMVQQVKEVLPHVPLVAISRDLSKTRNVDTTITNILEGRVQFVPEQLPTSQPSTSNSSVPSSGSSNSGGGVSVGSSPSPAANKDMFNTAASTFAKNATDRTKSFQERKEQLIASARRRYIEKHNLNIPF